MSSDDNRLSNADFAEGKKAPKRWSWQASGKQVSWNREAASEGDTPGGVTMECDDPSASARWSQVVVCKPGEHYRIDATVTCDLTPIDEAGGFSLSVQPMVDGEAEGPCRTTPVLHRSTEPIDIRSYFETDDNGRNWTSHLVRTGGMSFPSYIYGDEIPARLRGVITLTKHDREYNRIIAHELGHKLMNVSHEYMEQSPQRRGDSPRHAHLSRR